mmetsp:Transcript_49926/g.109034  ORF Transcript_49926/g.109034 Transcript_49926/m.109034 type:complete len:558 (+) Transcript_49926:122-1795(+)|eukprot:CAMPEP_0204262850 /NCGR_PEP_ID=MMETSP0468-20130131/7949_1 /ASSEMBLY_ACC=CAM_ASM_000383 /TAXON_ID=2969 /ORGANISM="Oxyrrhis marina" /LENGTH=557 /DNA_ID=CAMNT_0051237551 /DNA_START=74 /DNA_END=1747 /DNA_ORIENTATION=-
MSANGQRPASSRSVSPAPNRNPPASTRSISPYSRVMNPAQVPAVGRSIMIGSQSMVQPPPTQPSMMVGSQRSLSPVIVNQTMMGSVPVLTSAQPRSLSPAPRVPAPVGASQVISSQRMPGREVARRTVGHSVGAGVVVSERIIRTTRTEGRRVVTSRSVSPAPRPPSPPAQEPVLFDSDDFLQVEEAYEQEPEPYIPEPPRPTAADLIPYETVVEAKPMILQKRAHTEPALTHVWVVLIVGGGILFLITVVPVWNALNLLDNKHYLAWCGPHVPTYALFFFAIIHFVFLTTIFGVGARGRRGRTAEAPIPSAVVLQLAAALVMLIGVGLILLSIPLARQASIAFDDLTTNCGISPPTMDFQSFIREGQMLRQAPECKGVQTIHTCPGFAPAPLYMDYVQFMESEHGCAGFCAPVEQINMLQTSRVLTKTNMSQPAQGNTIFHDRSSAQISNAPMTEFFYSVGKTDNGFCAPLVARVLLTVVGQAARTYFQLGIYLLLIALLAAVIPLLVVAAKPCLRMGSTVKEPLLATGPFLARVPDGTGTGQYAPRKQLLRTALV